MDFHIYICACAAYLLTMSHHASAKCEENCIIQCPSSMRTAMTSSFRHWNRRSMPECVRECSYVCSGGVVLQIPYYVQRHRRVADNTKVLLPFPFAVEFYDEDGDEQISFSEFVSTVKCNDTDSTAREAFDLADTNKDELVSRQELLQAPFQVCLDDDDDWEDWDGDRHHRHHSRRRHYRG
ncbi:uncharacterized protein LOC121383431 [Gigantopelta aegis]|uniref:uncharacterized protein LOC121383431 n=1 Tax=Gigantopelta aegis TaxID=1735272 RepID=UPI001B88AD2E|nr:uncharacterized protein LOC121383431 [Gigantopelta aegis]